eukprot:TRINITY_DN3338_c0_g1_i1.p1 TRINITY_DN3338_c0_g1~~TRINITY_DN3338_c0_g1_i1.p1  ORF type:complete len:410 (+),score=119.25 TRINITY_DN3338_c0_g1_i1:68-1231(+)
MGKKQLKISTEIEEAMKTSKNFVSVGGSFHSGNAVVTTSGIDPKSNRKAILTLKPEDLKFLENIGQGSSGSVRKAVHLPTEKEVAVKEIKLTDHHLDEIGNELATLYKSQDKAKMSPHVIEFYGAYVQDGSAFIALQYMDGSLLDMLNPNETDVNKRGVPENILAPVSKMVLKGLEYLHHQRHLVHRDLKPSNLLFSNDGMIKITDFGVSQELESTCGDAKSFVGTVTYMSPERLKGETYYYSVDIWGLGISLVELVTGQHPFQSVLGEAAVGDSSLKFWKLVQHLSSTESPISLPSELEVSDEFKDFINQCLVKEGSTRTSAAALLHHPWITENTADDAEDYKDMARISTWLSQRQKEKEADPQKDDLTQDELHKALDKIADFGAL